MGVYRPMTSSRQHAAREEEPPALLNIGSMSPPGYPQRGCVPAVPASVLPGKIIVAPPRHAVLNFRVARHSPESLPAKDSARMISQE